MSASPSASVKDRAGLTPHRKLPVPVGVIVAALETLREKDSGGGHQEGGEGEQKPSGGPSPPTLLPYSPAVFSSTSNAFIEVEVETKQGYVYSGKLVDMDADYNVTMREATVRRERLCDVIRATRRRQRQVLLAQLGSLVPKELVQAELAGEGGEAEREGAATRPKFIGSVLIRSSNMLMTRFLQPSAPTAPSLVGKDSEKQKPATTDPRDPRDLRSAYRSAAVAIRKAMQKERTKDREARRKRLLALKKKRESG